jgi:hypothetical protein
MVGKTNSKAAKPQKMEACDKGQRINDAAGESPGMDEVYRKEWDGLQ